MTIQIKIARIKELLNEVCADVYQEFDNKDYSDVFRFGLTSKIQQAGGTYDPTIKDNDGIMRQKKFFAFKFNPRGNVEEHILYYMQRMFNVIDQARIDLSSEYSWNDLKFNIEKLEVLRDRDSFADLYRGIIYFRRKEQEEQND